VNNVAVSSIFEILFQTRPNLSMFFSH